MFKGKNKLICVNKYFALLEACYCNSNQLQKKGDNLRGIFWLFDLMRATEELC